MNIFTNPIIVEEIRERGNNNTRTFFTTFPSLISLRTPRGKTMTARDDGKWERMPVSAPLIVIFFEYLIYSLQNLIINY